MRSKGMGKVLALVTAVALLAGCSLFETKPSDEGAGGQPGRMAPLGRYWDFDDIQVPLSLKLNKEKSLVFRVGAFKAGLLSFSDNLEMESLINYFIDTMGKDNWQLKGSYKYPRVALFFAKPSKTCIIVIQEHTFTTDVEIWVAPAGQGS
jgi:hypothetical protein